MCIVDYIKKILGEGGISDQRLNMLNMIYQENIDIRMLNNLKRNLLDSKNCDGNLISIEKYIENRNKIFKGKTLLADSILLEEIKANEN